MIVVTFAMAEESKDFLPRLENRRVLGGRSDLPVVEGTFGGERILVVHLGVGPQSAAQRLRDSGALHGKEKPRLLLCPGYGGGLGPQLSHADLLLVENFSDPALLASAETTLAAEKGLHRGLLTSEMVIIESAADKAALHAKSGALAVDMETAAVKQVCDEAGIPMLALRAISDDAQTTLPVPGYLLWDLETQKPPLGRLAWHLVKNPRQIGALRRLLASLTPVRARLTDALLKLIPKL